MVFHKTMVNHCFYLSNYTFLSPMETIFVQDDNTIHIESFLI